MKFNSEIVIDLPRARVIELFDSAENMSKWQPSLVSFEHISGDPGQVGAKSKLVYRMGKSTVEMVETITKRDFPDTFDGTYEAKGVFNVVKNRFTDQGDKTHWEAENEFQFKGFMKVIGAIMPAAFRKESSKIMQNFKTFAEAEGKST